MPENPLQEEARSVSSPHRGQPQEPSVPVIAAPPGSSAEEDQALQQSVLSGDPSAQTTFVRRFSPILRKVVIRTLRRYSATWTDMAEDLLQDAWCDLLQPDCAALAGWRIDGGRSLKNYLCVFVRLRTSARLRRRQSPQFQPPIPEDTITRYLGGDPTVLRRIEDRNQIDYILTRLRATESERDMRIFHLSFFAEASAKEIAKDLGISTELVFTVRYRLRLTLFTLLDELLFGET